MGIRRNRGSKLVVWIAQDGLSATADIPPVDEAGSPVDLQAVLGAIRRAGVLDEYIEQRTLELAVEKAKSTGKPVLRVVVARGVAPRAAAPERMEANGNLEGACTLPGEVIATLEPATEARGGRTITGTPMPAPVRRQGKSLEPGLNCAFSDDGRAIVARKYGNTTVEGMTVHVRDGALVSEDQLNCTMDLFPWRVNGSRISVADLRGILHSMGILPECIDEDALAMAVADLWDTDAPIYEAVVAKGRVPTAGRPGRIERLGQEDVDCGIAGDTIARLHPPVLPERGLTVFGKPLPPEGHVDELSLSAGSGCLLSASEGGVLAETYGVPVVDGQQVRLKPGLRVSNNRRVVHMDIYPRRIGGSELTVEHLLGAIAQAGVDPDCIDQTSLDLGLVQAGASGKVVESVVVARALEPVAQDAPVVVPTAPLTKSCVLPGDAFARLQSQSEGRPGKDVLGGDIPSTTAVAGVHLVAGEGCRVSGDGTSLVADTYGVPSLEGATGSVRPGIHLSADGMACLMDLFPSRIGGEAVSLKDALDLLKDFGLGEDMIDSPAIETALTLLQNSPLPLRGVQVARGLTSDPGHDAVLHTVQTDNACVFPGDVVLSRVPFRPPVAGRQVTESALENPPGVVDFALVPGDHCTSDGENQITTEAYGQVVYAQLQTENEPAPDLRQRKHVQVSIQPGIHVREDELSVEMDIFPRTIDGGHTTPDRLVQALLDLGLDSECIQRDRLAAALKRAIELESIQPRQTVAAGREPIHAGKWHFEALGNHPMGCVFAGDKVGRLVADQEAVDGRDVWGKSNHAESQPPQPTLPEELLVHTDGLTIVATEFGRVSWEESGLEFRKGLRVAEDKMSCDLDIYPFQHDGQPLNAEALVSFLQQQGLHIDRIDREAIERVLALQKPALERRVAMGLPPIEGSAGEVRMLIDPAQGCVFADTPILEISAAQLPTAGMDVMGRALSAGLEAEESRLTLDEGCAWVENRVVSSHYGRLIKQGQRLEVRAGLRLENDMECRIDVYPRGADGTEIQAEALLAVLQSAGIEPRCIQHDALTQALESARERGRPIRNVRVASGIPPKTGTPGRPVASAENDRGAVFPGEEVARISSSRPPTPGLTVRGGEVNPPPIEGGVPLIAGDGCSLNLGGQSALSEVFGLPVLEDNVARVVPGWRIAKEGQSCLLTPFPCRANGEALEAKDIEEMLVAGGIAPSCLNRETLEHVLAAAAKSPDQAPEVEVARGTRRKVGQDGMVVPLENVEEGCVFSGDSVAYAVEPIPPQAGTTVTGKQLPPKRGVTRFVFQSGENCFLSEGADAIASTCYGIAVLESVRVNERPGQPIDQVETIQGSVVPGIRISEDLFSVEMDLYPQHADGSEVTVSDLISALGEEKVSDRCIEREVMVSALAEARAKGEPQLGVLVAKGQPALHGTDGRRVIEGGPTGQAGAQASFGRIDFRERDIFRHVNRGERVATLAPPTRGTAGFTVSGEVLDAQEGKEGTVSLGSGVDARGDEIYAQRDGVLSIRGDHIDVVALVVVEGDVDYSTGHVNIDEGAVRISGSVMPGFEVSAPEDIEITGVVEGGIVQAGGSVLVRTAILGGTEGNCRVEAGRNVVAKLARDAVIVAGGDVLIQKEAYNCQIVADGKVQLDTRPGTLSGGRIVATQGLSAWVIGSPQWSETTVLVGGDSRALEKLRDQVMRKRKSVQHLEQTLGRGTDEEILQSTSEIDRPKTKKYLAQRTAMTADLQRTEHELAVAERHRERQAAATVDVRGTLYPGVRLSLEGTFYPVDRELYRSHFYFAKSTQEVKRSEVGDRGPEAPAPAPEPEATEESAPTPPAEAESS